MTNGSRIALLAAVVVVAVVGFVVLKPDDKKDKKSSSQASQTAPTATADQKPKPKSKPKPVQVVVKDGKPAGGIKEIDADKGDRIRFVVSSDVSDEIHVHGYDLMKDVEAGGTASFSFPAKIDGEFEVELENRGEQIAKLVVQP